MLFQVSSYGSALLLLMTEQYDSPNVVKQKAWLTLIVVLKAVRSCGQIFPCDDANVGNEIYYTAEPCVDVEMTVPNESMNVPSIDTSITQTLTWPSLCVEKFLFDSPGIMFYTGLQTYEDFTFVLANAAYELNYLYYKVNSVSENQIFLTLIKLRQHKTNFELSRLFNISETFGNTIKLLVGATPGGLVNYASPAYGGLTSDRQICEGINLSSICDKGDSIMADKAFNVQDLFAPYDVSINIPTFFRKKNRMTGKQILEDRAISSKRVHIEKIIGLAKTYKILKAPLNITETKLASEITFVCFMLCNFKTCIIPETA
ncbi:unnamed protein product [Mytilus coruscus]|uniref:DDE Tnp4 domain-containing protein n=1 Tax=Mytilus coruscus TaxID=42192 RepID=A0A6J8ALQ3_MYTCO|nr:unnamed protein product [Mytilus coruscus]